MHGSLCVAQRGLITEYRSVWWWTSCDGQFLQGCRARWCFYCLLPVLWQSCCRVWPCVVCFLSVSATISYSILIHVNPTDTRQARSRAAAVLLDHRRIERRVASRWAAAVGGVNPT